MILKRLVAGVLSCFLLASYAAAEPPEHMLVPGCCYVRNAINGRDWVDKTTRQDCIKNNKAAGGGILLRSHGWEKP